MELKASKFDNLFSGVEFRFARVRIRWVTIGSPEVHARNVLVDKQYVFMIQFFLI